LVGSISNTHVPMFKVILMVDIFLRYKTKVLKVKQLLYLQDQQQGQMEEMIGPGLGCMGGNGRTTNRHGEVREHVEAL